MQTRNGVSVSLCVQVIYSEFHESQRSLPRVRHEYLPIFLVQIDKPVINRFKMKGIKMFPGVRLKSDLL